jgi:Cache domain
VAGLINTRRLAVWLAPALCAAFLLCPSGTPAASSGAGGKTSKAERAAARATKDLNSVLRAAKTQLIQLAALPSVQAADSSACTADVKARIGDARYGAFGASNLSGSVYCLSVAFTPPLSIADRAYFLRALGTRGFGVGDFQFGRATGSGAVGLGYPVISGGVDSGIVLATLATTWLDERLESDRHGARDLLLIDDHGTVTAHAGATPTTVGTNLGGVALVKKALGDESGETSTRFGGHKVRAAFETVPLSDGAMHVAAVTKR